MLSTLSTSEMDFAFYQMYSGELKLWQPYSLFLSTGYFGERKEGNHFVIDGLLQTLSQLPGRKVASIRTSGNGYPEVVSMIVGEDNLIVDIGLRLRNYGAQQPFDLGFITSPL